MTTVYVLALTCGKYYVGKTTNLARRTQEHFAGHGSAWTMKYPPLHIAQEIPNCDAFDEDKYVKLYMYRHGLDAVRGGAYSNLRLTAVQRETLQKEIWAATGKCVRCGRDSHFENDCFARADVNGVALAVAAVGLAKETDDTPIVLHDSSPAPIVRGVECIASVWNAGCGLCRRQFPSFFPPPAVPPPLFPPPFVLE